MSRSVSARPRQASATEKSHAPMGVPSGNAAVHGKPGMSGARGWQVVNDGQKKGFELGTGELPKLGDGAPSTRFRLTQSAVVGVVGAMVQLMETRVPASVSWI